MPDRLKDSPCPSCVYSEELKNKPNIKCLHPKVKAFKQGALSQGPLHRIATELQIIGKRGGWPFNYEPSWVIRCIGFADELPGEQPKEKKPSEEKTSVPSPTLEQQPEETEGTADVEEKTPDPTAGDEEGLEYPKEDTEVEMIVDPAVPDKKKEEPVVEKETPFTFGKMAKHKK